MKYIFSLVLLMSCLFLSAQIEGDKVFKNDQVVKIELNFQQTSFWDSLTLNYETETYMAADLILTDTTGTYEFPDVGVRLKGNSSYGHPGNKKSFKIDFNKYVSGQNHDGLKKLNCSNAFKDPTLMREKIFFDVCKAVGVPAPRANFADVFFNGTHWGFYTLVEQIDDQFLDWAILDDDGNLFKAASNFGGGPGGGGDEADLEYYGTDQSSYTDLYELKSNEDEDDWSDLIEFVDFINNSSSDVFESELDKHLELNDYLRSAALDNLFGNMDSYTESARNFYIYHNLTTDKWEWIKWDANESFGTYRAGQGFNDLTTLPINYSSDNRPLLENVFNNEVLFNRYTRDLCEINEQFFNVDYMHPRIDAIKAMIQDYVYADANKMYSDANFDTNIESNISVGGGPGGGNVYGLKSFVQQRSAFIQNTVDCSLLSMQDEESSFHLDIYPNPVTDLITISAHSIEVAQIDVININGKKCLPASSVNQSINTFDLTGLDPGVYLIQVTDTNGNQSVRKLIKL